MVLVPLPLVQYQTFLEATEQGQFTFQHGCQCIIFRFQWCISLAPNSPVSKYLCLIIPIFNPYISILPMIMQGYKCENLRQIACWFFVDSVSPYWIVVWLSYSCFRYVHWVIMAYIINECLFWLPLSSITILLTSTIWHLCVRTYQLRSNGNLSDHSALWNVNYRFHFLWFCFVLTSIVVWLIMIFRYLWFQNCHAIYLKYLEEHACVNN